MCPKNTRRRTFINLPVPLVCIKRVVFEVVKHPRDFRVRKQRVGHKQRGVKKRHRMTKIGKKHTKKGVFTGKPSVLRATLRG